VVKGAGGPRARWPLRQRGADNHIVVLWRGTLMGLALGVARSLPSTREPCAEFSEGQAPNRQRPTSTLKSERLTYRDMTIAT